MAQSQSCSGPHHPKASSVGKQATPPPFQSPPPVPAQAPRARRPRHRPCSISMLGERHCCKKPENKTRSCGRAKPV
eukprot:scaffold20267_cov114-Isochrysis_galbana.AAC.3